MNLIINLNIVWNINVILCIYIVSFVVKSPSRGNETWNRKLRIQGFNFWHFDLLTFFNILTFLIFWHFGNFILCHHEYFITPGTLPLQALSHLSLRATHRAFGRPFVRLAVPRFARLAAVAQSEKVLGVIKVPGGDKVPRVGKRATRSDKWPCPICYRTPRMTPKI